MIRTVSWVYIHIPKTSGTNFIKNSEIKEKNIKNEFIKYHRHFTHQPLWWWEDLKLVSESDYIFTIIRNPYDRFVSFYNHIRSNVKVMDFEDFIRNDQLVEINQYVEHNVGIFKKLLRWKVEWPQYKFIESNFNKTVDVYKLETDLKKLENFVGYKFSDTFYNKRNHPPWRQYYNKYTLDAIYSIYKEDFMCFDYKRE